LLIISIVVILIVQVIAPSHAQTPANGSNGNFSGTGPQSFSVGPDAQLIVKEQSGNISVFPGSGNTIAVEPRNHGTLVAPNPQNVRILYSRTLNPRGNDQITISTDPWFSNTDFFITIPETTVVQIAINAGSIDVHAGRGLSALTGSGSIALDNIQGPTHVGTDSGDVTATAITGSLTIAAQSGSIRMQGIKGQVQATTVSGDVVARNSALSGQSILQTQNGSVRFDGSIDPQGSYRMQTTSGDVDATLPADSAFSLDASTNSGTVQNAFGGNVVGNTPHAQLSMQTQNGSINIIKV